MMNWIWIEIWWIKKWRIEFELKFDELKKWWIEFELKSDELKKQWIEFELISIELWIELK